MGNAASLSIRELLRLRLLFASLYHANWPFSPDCTSRMENNLYLETSCRGSKLSLRHYGIITKLAAIWNKVYNGWVQEFPLAKGFALARFHLSYALFSSFDDDESFVIWWCILFHWWGSLPADVLWRSFVTLLGSILLSDSAYHVLTWDKAQFERFSYILPNGYRWNWTWYKLLLEVLIGKGSAAVSCELRIGPGGVL